MDFENFKALIKNHGAPENTDDIVAIVRAETGIDVSSMFVNQNDRAPFANFTSAEDVASLDTVYRDYRVAQRFSALVIPNQGQVAAPPLRVYCRNSSPIGYHNSINRIRSFITRLRDGWNQIPSCAGVVNPYPIILDQNNRVDTSAKPIGDIDHLRIQSIHVDAPQIAIRLQLIDRSNYIPQVTPNHDLVNQLRNEGWNIVVRDGYVIGAYLDEEFDPLGKQLVVFHSPDIHQMYFVNQLTEMMLHLKDRWNRPNTEIPDSLKEVVGALRDFMDIHRASSMRYNDLQEIINENRESHSRYQARMANVMRQIVEAEAERKILGNGLVDNALEQYRSVLDLVPAIKQMNPVFDARMITRNGDRILQVDTHYFGMRCPYDEEVIVRIPRIRYDINMSSNDFQYGIRVFGIDRSELTDNGYTLHPHVYYDSDTTEGLSFSPCWGRAGEEPLPDAWARRDWITLVRMLLSWHVHYNGDSPHIAFDDLQEYLPSADRSGWLTDVRPEESQEEDSTEVTEVVQPAIENSSVDISVTESPFFPILVNGSPITSTYTAT